jgi:hypothetical protein
MGADKNTSRRRWRLQQDEHGFQHTSPTHYPSWPSPRSHWSATILGTNKQPSEPKHTKTHSGYLHGLLPMLHRSDRWPVPVIPVTPVRPLDSAGRAGGYSSRTTNVPESLSDFSSPGTKHPKTRPARKENSTQNLRKQLQTDQELTSSTKTQRHTSQAVHPRQIPQVARTGQTGQEHRSHRCNQDSSG